MRQSPDHFSWTYLSAAVTAGARCAYCGSRDHLVAHHKVPRRFGGLDQLSNLEPVCPQLPPTGRAGGDRPRQTNVGAT